MTALEERLLFREKYCFGKRKTLLKPKERADQDLGSLLKRSREVLNRAILMENYKWDLDGGWVVISKLRMSIMQDRFYFHFYVVSVC